MPRENEIHFSHESNPNGRNTVAVTLNNDTYEIQRGNYKIPELKSALGINSDYVIDQIIAGEFIELSDDGKVVIKGGEVFVSHVRSGCSS